MNRVDILAVGRKNIVSRLTTITKNLEIFAVAIVGFCLLVMLLLSPLFADSSALDTKISIASAPPGSGHFLGTDRLGRDVLALLIAGTPATLIGPLVIAFSATILGWVVGTIGGYVGGIVDQIFSRVADIIFTLPLVLVALVLTGLFDSGYWTSVFLLAIFMSPGDMRILRSATITVQQSPYIAAAIVSGVPKIRILLRHIVPNTVAPAVANAMLNLPGALFAIAALSYLGVGSAAGSDWGYQLAKGQSIMFANPWAVLAPAIAIIVVSMAANAIADRLVIRLTPGAQNV